jgi:hypothetical protein
MGLSRRELEWVVAGMTRTVPSDPAALTRMICDVVMALIEKNNAALVRDLTAQSTPDEGGGSS